MGSRSGRYRWLSSKTTNRRRSATRRRSAVPFSRPLRFEPLEERRLLANVTVGNDNDVVNGTVTSIADLIASDGGDGISLREAILAANADAAADIIDFSVTGTIQLTNVGHAGEIAISNDLTINGPGADLLTIRGFDPSATLGDGARIFHIEVPFITRTVAISGLTLTGGDVASSYGGGAILSTENLTLINSTISGNNAGTTTQTFRGGGIANVGGNLSVIASTISGNSSRGGGAGISSYLGTLSITRSTISGNAANLSSGGGIRTNSVTTTIDSSTISGNSADGAGGGIYSLGAGITITNSTISGNSARSLGGGIFAASGLTVRHSTITLNRSDSDNNGGENGGGLSGAATLDHTIVAGNLRSTSTRDDVSGTVVAASAYNLIGVDTGLTGISNGTNGNQIGTGASPIAPRLAPLADNGGPTLTHAFLSGSPAVDAGDPSFASPPDFDQRGSVFPRVRDGDGDSVAMIDIGAFEQQTTAVVNIVVDTLADENDGNYLLGDVSLREAIDLANISFGPDTIMFAASLTSGGPATILLTLGEVTILDSATIQGPSANLLTIDASGSDPTPNPGDGSRVFNVDDGNPATLIDVEIVGLTLTGGDTSASGGSIATTENLVIADSVITGNTTTSSTSGIGGGGIFSAPGSVAPNSLTIRDSTISHNVATGYQFAQGGGIHSGGGSATITGSTISHNSATGYLSAHGGGIFGDSLTVRHSTITRNGVSTSIPLFGMGGGGGLNSVGAILEHTIVAGNFLVGSLSFLSGPDIRGSAAAHFSLIGDSSGATIANNGGNQIGTAAMPIDPVLGPLADNGGPTMTHALLAGSPAIDAGDPAAVAGVGTVPQFDQRGDPYTRVFDGNGAGGARIDIGAFELIPDDAVHVLFGDYNRNGTVDAADYTTWRDTLGQTGLTPYSGADGNGDGMIGPEDYQVWKDHFGQTFPMEVGGGGQGSGAGASLALVPVQQPPAPPGVITRDAITNEIAPATRERRLPPAEPGADARMGITNARQHAVGNARQHAAAMFVARHDDALLAWLASTTDRPRANRHITADRFDDVDEPRDLNDTNRNELDKIDHAFALAGQLPM